MGDVPNSWGVAHYTFRENQVQGLSWVLKCSGKTLGYNQELKGADES